MFFPAWFLTSLKFPAFGKNDRVGNYGLLRRNHRKRLDQDQASQLLAESSGDRSGGHFGGKFSPDGWIGGGGHGAFNAGLFKTNT